MMQKSKFKSQKSKFPDSHSPTPVRAGFDRRFTVSIGELFAKPAPTTPTLPLLYGRVSKPVPADSHSPTPDRASCLRIVVLGYIVRGALGGMSWHPLQYLMGLANLGHDVYFIEDSDDYPSCYDPTRGYMDIDPTYGLKYAASIFERVGLGDRWAYYDAHTSSWLGGCADRIKEICTTADLLLNLDGVNPLRPWLLQIPARALVEGDSVFTQIRHLTDAYAYEQARQHTTFFSCAENIGQSKCTVPDDGFPWQPTRQPIVLDTWLVKPLTDAAAKFTTVMQWESYPAREYKGIRYGLKADAFPPYIDLPKRVGSILELAVSGGNTPTEQLATKGWRVREPPTRSPWTYQEYIQQSKAEFSITKDAFAVTWSGLFSERSACYLASGRPVVIQDTGFSNWLPTGAGAIAFSNLEEAIAGIEAVNSRYEFHCQAARAIAQEYFDARHVLPPLLEAAMK
ncbi:hypothetical protein C7B80_33850 [Cyanosarcina cf. burmensis CCALA 770]|nr:hypothetical protein C7B80_33850 [Cyanosarcina cf. burmensis CCALA 770]